MRLNSIVRLANVASLLAFTKSTPGTVASTLTVIDTPAQVHLFTVIQGDAPPTRLLRTNDEERVSGLTMVADLVKAGISKVDDIKYSSLLNNLKLGDDFAAVVKSSQMEKLSKFVTKFNLNKDPADQISFIGKLSVKYGDDVVARTLIHLERSAEGSPNLRSVVRQLRDEQVTNWLKNGKSVDDVFDLLKLKGDGYRVLRSRKLPVMEDYITKFNTKMSGDESVLAVMTKSYGGENNLVPLLAAAKRDPETVTKAKELENALLTKWKDDNLPLLTVWSRLKFGERAGDALSSGKLDMFYKYVKQNYPYSETSVINRFAAKYGDMEVARALVSAKVWHDTDDIAKKLQGLQLESWVTSGKSADDIFTSLTIKSDEFLFRENWKREILEEYVKLFNSKQTNPQDKTHMFRVLRNGYGGDGNLARAVTTALERGDERVQTIAHRYERDLYKRWFGSKIEPENLYTRFLNVEEASAGTLEKKIVSGYKTYYDSKVNPLTYTFNHPRRS